MVQCHQQATSYGHLSHVTPNHSKYILVSVNKLFVEVMETGSIFLTRYDKQIALGSGLTLPLLQTHTHLQHQTNHQHLPCIIITAGHILKSPMKLHKVTNLLNLFVSLNFA